MTLAYVHTFVLPAALALLPPRLDTPAARALLLAIGLQESRFLERRQIGGPARGFWQFELAGVLGVIAHPAARKLLDPALEVLRYAPSVPACHTALEHNDMLAAVFARVLLYTLPGRLPARVDAERAWGQYLEAWRPGKPHWPTWEAFYVRAWELVEPLPSTALHTQKGS